MSFETSFFYHKHDFFKWAEDQAQTLDPLMAKAIAFQATLYDAPDEQKPSFITSIQDQADAEAIQKRADFIKAKFHDVVILGTGGSSLGARILVSLNALSLPHERRRPRLHFADNLSAHTMAEVLSKLDLQKTHFLVISKSGSTAETLAQFLVCRQAIPYDHGLHFTVVTEPGDGPLRNVATKMSLPILDHPANLGGRFSVFSIVGLLPALLARVDINALRSGAKNYLDNFWHCDDLRGHPAIRGAVMAHYMATEQGANVSFMMPYDHNIITIGQWYQQLWAESLGKKGQGQTPVRAIGPLDQHSQLQLLVDGPKDKVITLITEDARRHGPVITLKPNEDPRLEYLNGHTIGDLVHAEAQATLQVLKENNCPVRHISYKKLDEGTLGALLMHFMLETVITAHLMGVNAYNQPAVEEGKHLTRVYLSKRAKE